MSRMLEGGCFVTGLREGVPRRQGTLQIWNLVGRDTGAVAISLRALEMAPGVSPAWSNPDCDEILYVMSGSATIFLDGRPFEVVAGTGAHLAPGVSFSARVAGPAPLVMVSSRCPEPGEQDAPPAHAVETVGRSAAGATTPIVRLADREACPTGDRWYRVLVDRDVGCLTATQFVGSIPPGRAPDHHHHYEEVLCILRGSGRMWAGAQSAPIEEGSCIFLPRGQSHCVENTGGSELWLLGVFHPAGSPAVRY